MVEKKPPAGISRRPAEIVEQSESKWSVERDAQKKALEALAKARSHLDNAEALRRKADFPFAYSTLVLSAEEEAKYILYRCVAIGIATFNPNLATDRILLREKDLRTHPIKQGMFVFANFLYALILAGMALAERNASGETVTHEAVMETIQAVISDMIGKGPGVEDLEVRKQAGFYSGNTTTSGYPAVAGGQEEYDLLHDLLSDRIEAHEATATVEPDPREIQEGRANFRAWRAEHGVPIEGNDIAFFDNRSRRRGAASAPKS